MKKGKRVLSLLLVVMIILSLCACSSGRSSSGRSGVQTAANTEAAFYSGEYDVAEEASFAMGEYDAGDYGLASVAASSMAYGNGQQNKSDASDAPTENPDKIIYSSDVTVETTQFDETVGKISGLVEEYGGWIESSSVSGSNYYQKSRGNASTRDAAYTLRIPSSRFQELMDSLSGLGNIPYSHICTSRLIRPRRTDCWR